MTLEGRPTTYKTVAAPLDVGIGGEDRAASFLDRSLSRRELAAATVVAARGLHGFGVRRGDRVALLLDEVDASYLALALGATRLGAIVVPLNTRFKAAELGYVLADAGATLLVASAHYDDVLAETQTPADCRRVTTGAELKAAGDPIEPELIWAAESELGPWDPARIIYTSGTTSHPKGCLHTHGALLAQGAAVAERLELGPEDTFWTPLPMFHTAGWSTLLGAMAAGSCFAHCGFFEPGRAVAQLADRRCTVLFPGFETVWMAVLDHPDFDPDHLSAARLVINVGVPERMEEMQARVPDVPQVSNTGSTEACGWLAIGTADESAAARTRSAGRPLAGMEVRIVDPTDGTDLPAGEAGEMVFRGPCRIREYWADPAGTAAAIDSGGWFHSGDLVRREADGTLTFVSRIKDMLKVGGENVAAAEVEGYLLTHPAIRVAQVVAAPDARYGEVPAAFVQLEDGADLTEGQLIEFCVGQIATFKVPRYLRLVDQWPMSGTKVRKVELRERIAAELAAHGITQADRIGTGTTR